MDRRAGFRICPGVGEAVHRIGSGRGGVVAAGHFRTWISPSPITGTLVAEAVMGQPTTLPLEPFAYDAAPAG